MSKKKAAVTGPSSLASMPAEKNQQLRWITLSLLLLVAILYAKTINYQFTLDDDLFYLKHKSVQQGLSGFGEFFSYGSLNKFDGTVGVQPYRPITLLFFGVQKTLFNNSPAAAHVCNVLLYALLSLILYSLLQRLFPKINAWYLGLMALLFVAHPVHTEVVCSVKSADELLAALFGFMAWRAFATDKMENKFKALLLGTFFYALAIFSKESAIAFLLIIPLSAYMLQGKSIRQALFVLVPLGMVTILFLGIRHQVVGNQVAQNSQTVLENVLYGAHGLSETLATKLQLLFYYVKLALVPWPLTWDYSYSDIAVVNWSSWTAIAALLIYGSLTLFAVLKFRKQPVLAFCILFFFLASSPTNNLFNVFGANFAERFLFVPSWAVCIGLVWVLMKWMNRVEQKNTGLISKKIIAVSVAILVLFSGLSLARSGDWSNNQQLMEKGVEVSPSSWRTNCNLANHYLDLCRALLQADQAGKNPNNEELRDSFLNVAKSLTYVDVDQLASNKKEQLDLLVKARDYYIKSLAVYPNNAHVHYKLGECLSTYGDTTNAIVHYRAAVDNDSADLKALNNLGELYRGKKKWDSAELCFRQAIKYASATDLIPQKNLKNLLLQKQFEQAEQYRLANPPQYDNALIALQEAEKLDAGSLPILEQTATIYLLQGKYDKAIEYANRALTINPNSKRSYGILSDTYKAMGKTAEADAFLNKFKSLR